MIMLKNVHFHYKRSKPLFQGLNIELHPGCLCGLLGKNGAGKTTLLKIMAGLRFPKMGECSLFTHIPSRRKPSFLSSVYFLPEQFHLPNVSSSTYMNLYGPFYPDFNTGLFKEGLQGFDIDENRKINDLSAGQRKKMLLAFGFATQCRIMLFDEPTNDLDIPSKKNLRQLLARFLEDDKIVILSTHQVRDVENMIDTILILDKGKILLQKSITEITSRLLYTVQSEEPGPEALYVEKQLRGFAMLASNETGEESGISLEVLFNAVISDNCIINCLMTEKAHYG